MSPFPDATSKQINVAVEAAEKAFATYAHIEGGARAAFLNQIAANLETASASIIETAHCETALPVARLNGELGRTTGQLRMFADMVAAPEFPKTVNVPADPDRAPLPRPDLRLVKRPVGPVAVFGASNFPLAFSVAGGDTASALAAGCPVVVKAHPAHPQTSDLVALEILSAQRELDLPDGVFGMVHGGGHQVGSDLVRHPLISAVGFTGSLRAGRALFDLCAARPVPIPFFGELGSINPVFVMPGALAARGQQIAQDWAASLMLGVGQFCTNPGVMILPEGAEAERFIAASIAHLKGTEPQPMLTEAIANGFHTGAQQATQLDGAQTLLNTPGNERSAGPALVRLPWQDWVVQEAAQHEVFGPLGMIITAPVPSFQQIAGALAGQLTATVHHEANDEITPLVCKLERKAGRIVFNGFPTGVEVSPAMMHGGPYPASTNFGATSVGGEAIERWHRSICFQRH